VAEGGTGGGGIGCGTVFALSPPSGRATLWTETVLYRFRGGNDGKKRNSGVIMDANGGLYGSTSKGGTRCAAGCGTVFKLVP
jgi:uncharacterized repeat protein (TIGR03803 family)